MHIISYLIYLGVLNKKCDLIWGPVSQLSTMVLSSIHSIER